ncbi:MAG: NAD-dependent epimerase/dehydratase family protein [Deltaproteobacteria bacterium]|jgi:nucleoside-diphosphate-sugar epimerase|nr:NAD-dependent epimerase/dehydratase family protein [Deltaproteobacteria bacterium]
MLVLVTGGGGFLGKRVIELLIQEGFQARAYLRRPLPELREAGAEAFYGTLEDQARLEEAARGAEAVIHLAAKTGVWGRLDDFLEANARGTERLLDAARKSGARYFVHASTPSVVHRGGDLVNADESAPYLTEKRFPYPYSKMLAERAVLEANSPSFKTLALRPHLVWGPGDPHFLPRLFEMERRGKLKFFKGGPYLVSHTYIDNAAHAHVLALKSLAAGKEVSGLPYFISEPEPMDVKELVNSLLRCGNRPEASGEAPRFLGRAYGALCEGIYRLLRLSGEPPMTAFTAIQLSTSHYFNIQRAVSLLDYRPLVTTKEAFSRLALYLKEHPPL